MRYVSGSLCCCHVPKNFCSQSLNLDDEASTRAQALVISGQYQEVVKYGAVVASCHSLGRSFSNGFSMAVGATILDRVQRRWVRAIQGRLVSNLHRTRILVQLPQDPGP